jgi:hypothetical protein
VCGGGICYCLGLRWVREAWVGVGSVGVWRTIDERYATRVLLPFVKDLKIRL